MDAAEKTARAFALERFSGLADDVIARAEKIPASGIFGDDHGYKSVWDELRHHLDHGPFTSLEPAFESTFWPLCRAVVDRLSPAERKILFFGTEAWVTWDGDDETSKNAPDDPEEITKTVWKSVSEKAAWIGAPDGDEESLDED